MSKIHIAFVITFLFAANALASNSFNCTIKDVQTTNSSPDTVIVHMNCSTGAPVTQGCTGMVSDTSFAFNIANEHGKMNLSLILMAFASGKQVYASHYNTCSREATNIPLLYGLKVFGK